MERWKDDSEFFGKRLGWIIDIVKLMIFFHQKLNRTLPTDPKVNC